MLRPEINHRLLSTQPRDYRFLHSNYPHTGAPHSHHIHRLCDRVLPFSYASHSPQAAAMHLCPFFIVETWDEDDLFRTGEACLLSSDTTCGALSFSYSAVMCCAKFVGAHVTACLIDMLELSTFRTLRILQFCVEGRLAVRLPSLVWASVGNTEYESVSRRGDSEVREDEPFSLVLTTPRCPTTRGSFPCARTPNRLVL
jgi:hypothetical protein